MTPLQLAQKEWEDNTTCHPKKHQISKFRLVFHTHEFRQFEQAIALLNWSGDCIEITKLEKLPGQRRGAAIPLVKFLKTLADKYNVRIFGHVKPYTPDPPWPDDEHVPTQEELEAWYKKHGFQLSAKGKLGAVALWYPDVPRFDTDDGADCLPVS